MRSRPEGIQVSVSSSSTTTGIGTLRGAPEEWPGGEPPPCPEPEERQPTEGEEGPPPPSEPRDFDFPEVVESTLDNGLPVLTIRRPQLPLVYIRLVVRSGSASDPL